MAPQILTICGLDGSGKKTLIGSLIHKFGLELDTLERLEKNNIKRYNEIPMFFEKNNLNLHFYGPSSQYFIKSQKEPDLAFWVVDATDPDRLTDSRRELELLLSSGSLQPKERLVVLVNKMYLPPQGLPRSSGQIKLTIRNRDQAEWSEQSFNQAAEAFGQISFTSAKLVDDTPAV